MKHGKKKDAKKDARHLAQSLLEPRDGSVASIMRGFLPREPELVFLRHQGSFVSG
jgi:hypothetical protein